MSGSSTDVLAFDTGKAGCLLPVLGIVTFACGWWALHPDRLDSDGRRGWWIELVRPMTVGGLNVPFLLFTAYLLWEFFRIGSRWADRVAVHADDEGLLFHWTLLRRRRVPWSEVRRVERRIAIQGLAKIPEILFRLDRRTVAVRAFVDEGGSADRFVERVNQRLGRS